MGSVRRRYAAIIAAFAGSPTLRGPAIMTLAPVLITYSRTSTGRNPMTELFARRSILGYCIGGAASAVVLASASRSEAATTTFKASLDGKSEVPPNTTSGTASVTVTYDPATKKISWDGTYS